MSVPSDTMLPTPQEGATRMSEPTDRQSEILALLHEGMKARAIGEKLGISRNAVYQQIQALKRKGMLEQTYTPSGEVRTQTHNGPYAVAPGMAEHVLLRVIESQQHTIEAQAQTCARLAAKLADAEKTQ